MFKSPLTVTIQYSPQDIAVISDEGSLALWWWDGAAWVDATTSASRRELAARPVSGVYRLSICRTGLYSLYGPTKMIFMPVIVN